MASSANDEAQVLRFIDDSDGIDTIMARVTAAGVAISRVEIETEVDSELRTEVPTLTHVVRLVLDEEEMDVLATWWRNRRLRERASGAS